jgi:hypothetical protein
LGIVAAPIGFYGVFVVDAAMAVCTKTRKSARIPVTTPTKSKKSHSKSRTLGRQARDIALLAHDNK